MRSGARMVVSIHRSGNLHASEVVRNYLCEPPTGPAMIRNHCRKFRVLLVNAELDAAQGLTVTALKGDAVGIFTGKCRGGKPGKSAALPNLSSPLPQLAGLPPSKAASRHRRRRVRST